LSESKTQTSMNFQLRANYVAIQDKKIFPAVVTVQDGLIRNIDALHDAVDPGLPFLLPGFIDAHIHIESSMLVPSEFARLAVVHGTVATVSDPHEIANVCGLEGVRYMIENGRTVPFKFFFGAPSCVPATPFETAGASLDAADVARLLGMDEIRYLSEMMNFPGVLHEDPEVMQKIAAAQASGKPVDGHAPGLRGAEAKKYIGAGISTDHECFTAEEALDKIRYGMKIIIREGSAAKNFEALIPLLHDYPQQIMFCSDDKHPDSLVLGHINELSRRAIAYGIDVFKVLQAACVNPVLHYKLPVGLLQKGDAADFILVKDLRNFEVLRTYIGGEVVAENGRSKIKSQKSKIVNQFRCALKSPDDFACSYLNEKEIWAIEALDGQLITNKLSVPPKFASGKIIADPDQDLLKIAVVNRYRAAPVAVSFIKNFGLKSGALASSVAHDSHNIVAVGADDHSLCRAVNLVIEQKGGISCVGSGKESLLPLPVAGLMTTEDGYRVAEQYAALDAAAKALGAPLSAPFMTLSFMALLVIPHLKLSDKGLFDGDRFAFAGR
jgi:adenine deaminase